MAPLNWFLAWVGWQGYYHSLTTSIVYLNRPSLQHLSSMYSYYYNFHFGLINCIEPKTCEVKVKKKESRNFRRKYSFEIRSLYFHHLFVDLTLLNYHDHCVHYDHDHCDHYDHCEKIADCLLEIVTWSYWKTKDTHDYNDHCDHYNHCEKV